VAFYSQGHKTFLCHFEFTIIAFAGAKVGSELPSDFNIYFDFLGTAP
jgi:hypothetical protein